jgi:hypothetical protein
VAAPATVARAERKVSETRAAPTAAVPAAERVGAATTDVRSPGAGRTPVFNDEVATTGARPIGAALGVTTPEDDVRPVDPVVSAEGRVIVGPVAGDELVVPAGTAIAGAEVRTVGSESATLGVDVAGVAEGEVDAGVAEPGVAEEPDDTAIDDGGVEPGAGFAAGNVDAVLTDDDVPPAAVPDEVSDDRSAPDADGPERMMLVGDSPSPAVASDPPEDVVSVAASGVSGASVEAPTAPDFACVSVIDQSCS